MSIKAVVFDIGQTLVYYPFPLNWSALYRPAFEHVEKQNGLHLSEEENAHILNVLAKYNTRIHPREKEVSSDQIFSEIKEGLRVLSEKMGVLPSEIAFVGDEKKDIECAKSAGAAAVLINRTKDSKDYGQDDTIGSLDEIFDILK